MSSKLFLIFVAKLVDFILLFFHFFFFFRFEKSIIGPTSLSLIDPTKEHVSRAKLSERKDGERGFSCSVYLKTSRNIINKWRNIIEMDSNRKQGENTMQIDHD